MGALQLLHAEFYFGCIPVNKQDTQGQPPACRPVRDHWQLGLLEAIFCSRIHREYLVWRAVSALRTAPKTKSEPTPVPYRNNSDLDVQNGTLRIHLLTKQTISARPPSRSGRRRSNCACTVPAVQLVPAFNLSAGPP